MGPDGVRLSRRTLLRVAGAAAVAGSTGCAPNGLGEDARDTLIVVSLRGGMDGMSFVVPHGDDDYYSRRPTIAVPASEVFDLDGYFGLNPVAAPLLRHFQAGRLALVHAVGHTQSSRSHFQSIRHVEEGHSGIGSIGSGWGARHLAVTPAVGAGPGRAIALQAALPPVLQGGPATIPAPSLARFGFGGPPGTREARMGRLRRMYGAAPGLARSSGLAALGLVHAFQAIDFAGRQPDHGAEYPGGRFGTALHEAASLIKARAGIEVIQTDFGGWDDHRDLGPLDGAFAGRLGELSLGLDALMTDLGADANRVTILVMSEFGRSLRENGSHGTSHGRGGVAMVLGGSHVRGGRVHRDWPGLGTEELDRGALRATLDVRDVIAEILKNRLSNQDLSAVLPGHLPSMPGIVTPSPGAA